MSTERGQAEKTALRAQAAMMIKIACSISNIDRSLKLIYI